MTNKSILENRISLTKKYLGILERYKKYSQAEIEEDVDIRGAVERYLYLAVQSAIDLAEAVISHRGFRKPVTMGESFRILQENGIIESGLAGKLARMTGFRNIIAHDYGEIDYSIVYDILQKGLNDIEDFIVKISKSIDT